MSSSLPSLRSDTDLTTIFACEEPSLENHLRKQAGQDVKRQVAACFILKGEDGEIKGYYILSADSVDCNLIPEHFQKRLPYKNLPSFYQAGSRPLRSSAANFVILLSCPIKNEILFVPVWNKYVL